MRICQVVFLTCTIAGCGQLCQSWEPKACWDTETLPMSVSVTVLIFKNYKPHLFPIMVKGLPTYRVLPGLG